MKLIKTIIFCLSVFSSLHLDAQSQYQFTQYNFNPLYLNPAQTGAFEGTYRVGGIYRSQWNVANNYYRPLTGYVDAPLLLIKKRHWVGLGLMYSNDKAGKTNPLVTRLAALSASFHYSFDQNFKNVLTLGVQFGGGGTRLEITDDTALPSEKLTNNLNSTARAALETNKSISYTDVNIGVLFKSKLNKTDVFSLGFNLAHLNKGNASLLKAQNQKGKVPIYFASVLNYDRKLNNKLSLHPSLLVHKQTDAFTANPQVQVGYKMTNKSNKQPMILKSGLGYRVNGNAINVLAGIQYEKFQIGLGYDLNTGSLQDAARDGIEIGVQYIAKIYKNPKVKPMLICPKY